MEFAKAVLEEVVDGPGTQRASNGARITVQINPATLRLQMASTADFGKDAGRQKAQYQGSTSTLSFDLVFDTADEGTTESPLDVRTRTRQLERFVLPAMKQAKAVPPRVRFTYGSFSVVGVMTVLNQDFDFFARNGVPLRAKCAVTIKEQRPEFDATLAGSGANTGAGATPPVPPGAGAGAAPAGNPPGTPAGSTGTPGMPGSPGTLGGPPAPPPDRSATALAGESAPDLAVRMGLDPHAWKGLQGITDPLSLPAGLPVDFSSALSAGPGLGVTTGAAVPPQDLASLDGAALASAGGLTRVLAAAATADAGAAAQATRQDFVPGRSSATPSGATSSGPASSGPAMSGPAMSGPAMSGLASSDPRAVGYGFGVPLRPRTPVGHAVTAGLVSGGRRAVAGAVEPPRTADPTVAGWLALREDPDRAGGGCGGAS
ncbi:hypothetical protein FXF51_20295 [Nonomuraea sp. PA05]|uniref:CIS tube protein n=1 Tax=Nonomuraea sp. PA05 TaxID=2604466 RepID=UPI0011D56610|nr:hypothetical protein [Nonomuraea sp. PA05]TYB64796.1 hypothetical protein FXF51_20295 [Nonomuraea sp. PA05]